MGPRGRGRGGPSGSNARSNGRVASNMLGQAEQSRQSSETNNNNTDELTNTHSNTSSSGILVNEASASEIVIASSSQRTRGRGTYHARYPESVPSAAELEQEGDRLVDGHLHRENTNKQYKMHWKNFILFAWEQYERQIERDSNSSSAPESGTTHKETFLSMGVLSMVT